MSGKEEGIKSACWHIRQNCIVIYNDRVIRDSEKLKQIVMDSIEESKRMEAPRLKDECLKCRAYTGKMAYQQYRCYVAKTCPVAFNDANRMEGI